jgi:hypothetical protein
MGPACSYQSCQHLPVSANSGRGWTAQDINFLTGITARRHHSQVRNNPWTTFFYGIIRHQKFAGRSPPRSDSTAGPFLWPQAGRRPARVPKKHQWQPVSLATGGPQAGEGFFEGNARVRPVPSRPRSRPDPVEGAARALPHGLGSNSGSTGLKHRVAWRWHSSTGPKYITIQRFLSSTAARRAAA